MTTPIELFRQPTDVERALILRLLEPAYPGRDEIRTMLQHVEVRSIDEQGSLKLRPEVPGRVSGVKTIPVEAEANDTDGVIIHVLLHMVHGRPDELEVYKDDSSPIRHMPPPAEFNLIVLPAAPWEQGFKGQTE
jgi:hypothetical protein